MADEAFEAQNVTLLRRHFIVLSDGFICAQPKFLKREADCYPSRSSHTKKEMPEQKTRAFQFEK
jgi:hypothetical protein